MNILINDVKIKIIYFLNYYFPDVFVACLTGSIVDQNFNEESDVDLWVISYERDYVFHETFIYEGLKIQVTQIPFTKIEEILWNDYFSRTGTYLGAFAKSEIINDSNDYLLNLITRCRTIYADGPRAMPVLELHQKKALVINLISDFKGSKSSQESFVTISELFSQFIMFYLHYNRGWTHGGGRHMTRNLRKHNAQLYEDLFSLYECYYKSQDKEPFIEFLNSKLQDFEGLDKGYTVSEGLVEVKQSYMVIQFYGLTDHYSFAKNKLPFVSDLIGDKIEDHLVFRTRAIGDSQINEDSLYLILFGSSAALLNEQIIPTLNDLIIKNRRVQANFPVNLDLSLIFSQQQIIRPLTAWIYALKKSPAFEDLTETKAFVAGFELFKLLHAVTFKGDGEAFGKFIAYVHALWFTAAFDHGRFFRTDQLILEKANMKSVFANQYAQQQNTLRTLFDEVEFRMIPGPSQHAFADLIPLLNTNQLQSSKIHPVLDTEKGSLLPKPIWIAYQNVLKIALASFYIPDNKMSYLSYAIMAIIQDKNQAPHENLAFSN
ncbi:nucleotidyltransferase domain-containing protein [Mucilaginibacter lappiensis]|uniref:Polymerase nucleotidyl transferase domain-containing protein n=1 Tax=Mucilaginibacter lappiensis TaxID=354630 RepID=A0A841JLV9_9SPHI|nr:nucleotidyltransferase domain-containing protein [Mucilaginibacter lappiensis]MBB6130586.1 hypothetical protein [Mucilaginibacter lappiensis]